MQPLPPGPAYQIDSLLLFVCIYRFLINFSLQALVNFSNGRNCTVGQSSCQCSLLNPEQRRRVTRPSATTISTTLSPTLVQACVSVFGVLACQSLWLDGFDQLCTVHALSSVLLTNLGNIEFYRERIEPGATGRETRMLPTVICDHAFVWVLLESFW